MRTRVAIPVVFLSVAALLLPVAPSAIARGGGGRGGGGGGRSGGGSFSRSSGSVSRPSGGVSRPSGSVSRPSYSGGGVSAAPRPSYPSNVARPSTGRLPTTLNRPVQTPAVSRGNLGGAAQLPSGARPSIPSRPNPLPARQPGQANRQEVGNFLGVRGGAGGGGGTIGNRPQTLPAARPGAGSRDGLGLATRPQERSNWSERSQNRNEAWNRRVDSRSESWNQRQEGRQDRRSQFQENRNQRWENLQGNRGERYENWREHREDVWDYRYDRADEVWDDVRDYHDDLFDDYWWGRHGWHDHSDTVYVYSDPWWWWSSPSWNEVTVYVYEDAPPAPVYSDYGVTNHAYVAPAAETPQPPPPLPPEAAGGASEWLPLGVYALVQEEKGDPTMFVQLSVNKEGRISGAYENTVSGSRKPIAGRVDKTTQVASWRIGENRETLCASTLANLTEDVSAVSLHFSADRVETWLLVRLPEPTKAGQPAKAPELKKTSPPAAVPAL